MFIQKTKHLSIDTYHADILLVCYNIFSVRAIGPYTSSYTSIRNSSDVSTLTTNITRDTMEDMDLL